MPSVQTGLSTNPVLLPLAGWRAPGLREWGLLAFCLLPPAPPCRDATPALQPSVTSSYPLLWGPIAASHKGLKLGVHPQLSNRCNCVFCTVPYSYVHVKIYLFYKQILRFLPLVQQSPCPTCDRLHPEQHASRWKAPACYSEYGLWCAQEFPLEYRCHF